MKNEKRFVYQGPKFPDPGITPCRYQADYFQKEMELESEAFYELRRSNDIRPHRVSESSAEELQAIAGFFEGNRDTFYFLFEDNKLIGSILFFGNYIRSVSISPDCQGKGYGRKLTMYAVNLIMDAGYSTVVLHTLPGNIKAERLYSSLGFKETRGLTSEEEMGALWANMMYAGLENSVLVSEIYRDAYGDLAPAEGVSPFSFVTNRDLQDCVEALRLEPGMQLLDLACGAGGPGLWIAHETGANLVGIDYSTKALQLAQERAKEFDLSRKAEFRHGSMAATGLEEGTFDGVMSIDAVWMAQDKQAVFHEVRRLLKSPRWFVFTTWQARTPGTGDLPTENEYRSSLEEAGFKIEAYRETDNWETLQREVYNRWLMQRDALEHDIGQSATAMLVGEATWLTAKLEDGTDRLSNTRRVFVACCS